jgi:hypothetical protein
MKFTRILAACAFIAIGGCVKATKAYNEYVSYHDSFGGAVEDFARGYSGAAQGDPFGPALDIMDEGRSLEATKHTWKTAAWVLTIATTIASLAAAGAKPAKQ